MGLGPRWRIGYDAVGLVSENGTCNDHQYLNVEQKIKIITIGVSGIATARCDGFLSTC